MVAEVDPTGTDNELRRGRQFAHARQIRPDSSSKSPGGAIPETCTVTAVRRGVVYYTNSTGFRSKIDLPRFHTILGQWMDVPAADDEA